MNRLFSIIFQIFDMEHAVYMTLMEFLSRKRQLPRGLNRGGGGPVLKHL